MFLTANFLSVQCRRQFQQTPNNVVSTGHDSSSGVLIMRVSVVVPEKLPGQKGVAKRIKKNRNFGAFSTSFYKKTPT